MVSAESIKSSRLQQGYYQTSNNNNNNHNPAANNSIVASAANNSASNISNGNNFGTELLFDDDEAGDITNTSPVAAQVYTADIRIDMGISPNVASPISELVDKRSLLTFSKSLNSTASQGIYSPIWKHPRFLKHRNTIFAAVALLLIGSSFIAVAIYQLAIRGSDTIAAIFFVIGLLMVLPGGYQTIYIYKALRGVPGYNFSGIPSFD